MTAIVTTVVVRWPRPNKYQYLWVLQGNYGYGWEDLTASESHREVHNDLKAYRENEGPHYGASYRIIKRRELNS